jgi:hypothetical protein
VHELLLTVTTSPMHVHTHSDQARVHPPMTICIRKWT